VTLTHLTTRPRARFDGRLVAPSASRPDPSADVVVAAPGRFHLYAGWFSPWAQRSTLVLALAGLSDVVSVSYIDDSYRHPKHRSRPSSRPKVNGFAQLREAYEATQPDFDGPISVPTLWDRQAGRVVTNDRSTLEIDLATAFGEWSRTGVELYPVQLRAQIDELEDWLGPVLNEGIYRTHENIRDARAAREELTTAFGRLERTLASSRYLLGDQLTLADVRLWVALSRFEPIPIAVPIAGSIVGGRMGRHLPEYSALWAYAQNLHQRVEFRATTDPDFQGSPVD
jgi:glutathionyl-hydroquinone reductase